MRNTFIRAVAVSAVAVGSMMAYSPAAGAAATPVGCVMVAGAQCEFTPVVGVGTLTAIFTGSGSEASAVVTSEYPGCPVIGGATRSDRPGVVTMPVTYQIGCTYTVFGDSSVTAFAEG